MSDWRQVGRSIPARGIRIHWEILATTRGRPSLGEHVVIGHGLHLVLESKSSAGSWIVRPQWDGSRGETTMVLLDKHGQTPLPPYIRHGKGLPGDQLTYQTVYAQWPGSVAAPTAGLHFTTELFTRLAASRITWVDVMLHVGLGTFRPIEAERLEDHVMHAERAELSAQVVATLESQREGGTDCGSRHHVSPGPGNRGGNQHPATLLG